MKKKYVSTIRDSVYNESDEHVNSIGDSSKKVEGTFIDSENNKLF